MVDGLIRSSWRSEEVQSWICHVMIEVTKISFDSKAFESHASSHKRHAGSSTVKLKSLEET